MSYIQSRQTIGQCPVCGGNIIEGKRGYGCSNWKKEDGGCTFVIWKIISGKLIMPQIVSKLLAEKEAGPFNGFHTEDEIEFAAILKLVRENEKWQVKVEASDAPPETIPKPASENHHSEYESYNNEKPEFLNSTVGECPACGGKVIERHKGYGCSNWESNGCSFIIWKSIAGKEISVQMAESLLLQKKIGPVDGFISKKGSPFSAYLKLVQQDEKWQVRFEFSDSSEPPVGKCPACGGNIIEGTKGYGCENWKKEDGGCKFVIWKSVAQKELSKKDVTQLLEDGITDILFGFISKKGGAFSARLKLVQDDNNQFKVVFDFSNSPLS